MATTLISEATEDRVLYEVEGKLKVLNEATSFKSCKAQARLSEKGPRYVIECIFERHQRYAHSRVNARRELAVLLSSVRDIYGAELLRGTITDDHVFYIGFKIR
jgi:hypothetical protein